MCAHLALQAIFLLQNCHYTSLKDRRAFGPRAAAFALLNYPTTRTTPSTSPPAPTPCALLTRTTTIAELRERSPFLPDSVCRPATAYLPGRDVSGGRGTGGATSLGYMHYLRRRLSNLASRR